MRILVKFYSSFREVTGTPEMYLEMPVDSTVSDLVDKCEDMFPKLRLQSDEIVVSLNKRSVQMGSILDEGDEVSFLPPVTGG
ncbi:MAG TPA: MoaD/ThiS family protein [Methanomassiliicoccales archaeon]|nr:MoaD/ThiS family protein [Methanomassiliicoccales archaeon]